MAWEKVVPKWEGDNIPLMEFTGNGYDWSKVVQGWVYTPQPRVIPVLQELTLSMGQVAMGQISSWWFAEFALLGTIVPIDLESVVLKIGGPGTP